MAQCCVIGHNTFLRSCDEEDGDGAVSLSSRYEAFLKCSPRGYFGFCMNVLPILPCVDFNAEAFVVDPRAMSLRPNRAEGLKGIS